MLFFDKLIVLLLLPSAIDNTDLIMNNIKSIMRSPEPHIILGTILRLISFVGYMLLCYRISHN
jgi:hypothetical protein